MPIITIAIAKGRTLDQKRTLAREITRVTAETLSVSPEKIWVRLDEFDKDQFAVAGTLMSDRTA
jgi:4-oxalocrotonate tautomerase